MRAWTSPTLESLCNRYSGMIIDLFGVLHDGVSAFPQAADALHRLRDRQCRICLLSNSPRRSAAVATKLATMGIERWLYDGLVTSGELVYQDLSRTDSDTKIEGSRTYFHHGPTELAELLAGLPAQATTAIARAQFILATGTLDDGAIDIVALQSACSSNLPMICANPDIEVMIGTQIIRCAGAVAQYYKTLGGKVIAYGKPHSNAYRAALDVLDLPASNVLAIGDSLATDIKGANRQGIASLLVLSGLHGAGRTSRWDCAAEIAVLCQSFGASPTYVMPRLQWSPGENSGR